MRALLAGHRRDWSLSLGGRTPSPAAADGAPRPRRRRHPPGRRQGVRQLAAARHRPGRRSPSTSTASPATPTPVKLNAEPLTQGDLLRGHRADLAKPTAYFVRPVVDGKEQDAERRRSRCPPTRRPGRTCRSRCKTPAGLHARTTPPSATSTATASTRSSLKQDGRGRDNSQAGATGEPILEAYKLDGTFLWRINLGKNIREGAHYTQFLVYDLDGDGQAEVDVQDRRRHGRRHGQGDRRRERRPPQRRRLRPRRPGVPHRLRRPDRQGAGDGRLPPAARQGRPTGATTTATASTASWPASPTSTASGRASSSAAATTRGRCWPPGTGATAS